MLHHKAKGKAVPMYTTKVYRRRWKRICSKFHTIFVGLGVWYEMKYKT